MKKSKLSLVLALIVLLSLVAPFATFATEVTTTEQTTSETTGEPVVTSENPTDASTTSEEAVTDGTDAATEGTEATAEGTEEQLEEVKGNYFEANTNIIFNKAVDGNVFLSGDTVTIKGQINGDLFVIAKDLVLETSSKVYGNLFTVCDNLTHEGLVYNLYAVAKNYECKYEGLAALDLKVFADHIKFAGYTERSVYFASDNIEITSDAYILGNLMYSSANEPTLPEGATVYGEKLKMDFSSILPSAPEITTSSIIAGYLFSAATLLGFVLLTLLVVSYFKPNTLSKEISFNIVKCLKALGLGVLSLIVLTVVTVLLFISTVFAKFAAVLLGLIILTCMVTSTIVILLTAIMLYNKFSKGKSKLFVILYAILASLVYFGLTIIPVVGFIIKLIINLIGFGFVILWLASIRKASLPEKVETDKKEKTVKEPKKIKENKKSDVKKDSKKETDVKKDNEIDTKE